MDKGFVNGWIEQGHQGTTLGQRCRPGHGTPGDYPAGLLRVLGFGFWVLGDSKEQ